MKSCIPDEAYPYSWKCAYNDGKWRADQCISCPLKPPPDTTKDSACDDSEIAKPD